MAIAASSSVPSWLDTRFHAHELYQLHVRDGFLDDRKNLNGEHRQEVVTIHHKADEAVEEHGKADVTVIEGECIQSLDKGESDMVVHVQEKHLTPVSLHDREQGVEEVEHLGQVEHEQDIWKVPTSVPFHCCMDHPHAERNFRIVVVRHRHVYNDPVLSNIVTHRRLLLVRRRGLRLALPKHQLADEHDSEMSARSVERVVQK